MKRLPLKKLTVLIIILCLTAAAASAEPVRVSVLYFDNNGGGKELDWLSKGFADMLLTDLALSDDLTVIEREELEKIIAEQKFSLSGMADEEQSLEIGKLLSAQLLITGSFLSSGGRLRIDAKILDTETGQLQGAVKSEGTADGIFGLETEIALSIFETLLIPPPDSLGRETAATYDAAQSYYQGMLSFDRGEYNKAIEFYKQASLSDPNYSKPREGLEAAYKFLKDFRRMRQQRELNKLLSEAAVLRARLEREPWTTYADFIIQEYRSGNTDNEAINKKAEGLGMFSGETPAVCAWNLQNKLLETADMAVDDFGDIQLADFSRSEIISIAVEGRKIYADDPFLPEIIYQQLLVTYYEDQYEASLVLCEELMMNYPDYRMMWAVEDFYEYSLEELSGD